MKGIVAFCLFSPRDWQAVKYSFQNGIATFCFVTGSVNVFQWERVFVPRLTASCVFRSIRGGTLCRRGLFSVKLSPLSRSDRETLVVFLKSTAAAVRVAGVDRQNAAKLKQTHTLRVDGWPAVLAAILRENILM